MSSPLEKIIKDNFNEIGMIWWNSAGCHKKDKPAYKESMARLITTKLSERVDKMTETITWCDKMDRKAYHLPSGCTHLGMREGRITKAFGIDSSTDTFYEFVVDSSCSSHEVIRLKWWQFSYTLVEEWLRNNMVKEAIRTLDRRIDMGCDK